MRSPISPTDSLPPGKRHEPRSTTRSNSKQPSKVVSCLKYFWNLCVCLLLLLSLYTTPQSPTALSCLVANEPQSIYWGLLKDCQKTSCSGWFHANSSYPTDDPQPLAYTQLSIGTSILWLLMLITSFLGKRRTDEREANASAKLPVVKRLRYFFHLMNRWVRGVGVLAIAVQSAGIFCIALITKNSGDSDQSLGTGFYMCFVLPYLGLQQLAPADGCRDSFKRWQKWLCMIFFFPVCFVASMLRKILPSRKRDKAGKEMHKDLV